MLVVEILLFAVGAPLLLRTRADKIPLKASHQALALSLAWLGMKFMAGDRPSDRVLLVGWLVIYALGSLVLLIDLDAATKRGAGDDER